MRQSHTRRYFLKASAAAAAVLSSGSYSAEPNQKTNWKAFQKAMIVSPADEPRMNEIKAAGFDGLEINLSGKLATEAEAETTRRIADKVGLRIHSVLRGWANFNDPAKAQADFDYTVETMKAAQIYGCDALLLVPGQVSGMTLPEKWGFSIEFDQKSGHISKIGDSSSDFEDYRKACNQAWDAFQEWVPKLIPVAEKTGVVVAIENVWSNLLNTPEHYKAFVDSFQTPWIRSYFDVANHIAYGRPAQDWIRILGDRIVKVHIKDYKVKPSEGQTEWPNLTEGSVNFPEVMKALKEVGYQGWLTIEGSGGLPLEEQVKRMDSIITRG